MNDIAGRMRDMALRLESKAAHVLRGDGSLDVAAGMLRDAADLITELRNNPTPTKDSSHDKLYCTHGL